MIDPVFLYAALAVLAAVLWLGALDKLIHPLAFSQAVESYRLLPGALVRGFALAFPVAELAAGGLLLWPLARPTGVWLSLGLLALATGGLVINLLRGRTDLDCGCGGLGSPTGGISWWLVLRNGLLGLLAILSGLSPAVSPRALGWLDTTVLLCMTATALILYLIFNQLIASHHRMHARSRT